MERTFVMLKPDCVVRGMIGKVISKLENKGLKIVGLKMVKLRSKTVEQLYSKHVDRPFFPYLSKFLRRTPVVCAIIEGKNVIEVVRKMCGITSGREAEGGTIRGDLSMSMRMNIIHASDTPEMVEREIAMFFKPREIHDWKHPLWPLMYDETELEGGPSPPSGRPRKTGKEDEPQ